MNPPRLLVVKLSAIGDVVMTLPALQAIREENPGAQITLLTGNAAAPVTQHDPNISERIVVDELMFWERKPLALLTLFWRLRRMRFSRVYIFHWSTWFHRYFWAMRIPERFGFSRQGQSFRLTRSVPYEEAHATLHDVNQYLHLVSDRYAADGPVSHPPTLTLTDEEEVRFANDFRQLLLDRPKPWIAVAPGGGNNPKLFMPQKRWPAEAFETLVQELGREATVFLIGDASENLLSLSKDLPSVVPVAGRLTLRETAILLKQCRLFIGNDSGLMHIAGALRIPTMAFFGPTSPLGKIPEWIAHRVLYTQESCSPCYRYGQAPPCPYDLKCLRSITPETALHSAKELLGHSHA